MAEVIESLLWRRMRYTPVSDALRWRISGRLDIRTQLEASGIPCRRVN